jgi:protein-disulfide isomerase
MRLTNTLVLTLIAFGLACARENNQVAVASAQTDSAQTDPRLARADLARIDGAPTAKTWLVVVSDFQCPYCKQWHDSASDALRREYVATAKIRVAYVNYPLGQHRHAVPTAEAAMCAGVQGKFWQYHDALFATQGRWQGLDDATSVLDSLASVVGLGLQSHKECRDTHLTLPLISADRDRANNSGARSTPTFLVDGRVLQGVYPMSALRPILDAAVARAAAR